MLRYLSLFALIMFAVMALVLWVAAGVAGMTAPHLVGEILHLAKSACALAFLSLAILCIVAVWIPRRAWNEQPAPLGDQPRSQACQRRSGL